jgi:hypothetical protein
MTSVKNEQKQKTQMKYNEDCPYYETLGNLCDLVDSKCVTRNDRHHIAMFFRNKKKYYEKGNYW